MLGVLDSFVEFSISGLWNFTDNVLGEWADDVEVLGGGGGSPLSSNVVLGDFDSKVSLRKVLQKHCKKVVCWGW